MDNCQPLIDSLREQLTEAFVVRNVGRSCVIDTPFSYPDSRKLSIFVHQEDDGTLALSDDGYGFSYARMAGVSNEMLRSVSLEVADRLGVATHQGEVVSVVRESTSLLQSVVSLVEGSQSIAESLSKKRLGQQSTRLDRQIASVLVEHRRVYRRHDKVPIQNSEVPVDVDYNVLPDGELHQLSLFAITNKSRARDVELITFRAKRIRDSKPIPGFTSRVVTVADDALAFADDERWHNMRTLLKEAGIDVVPVTDTRALKLWLTG